MSCKRNASTVRKGLLIAALIGAFVALAASPSSAYGGGPVARGNPVTALPPGSGPTGPGFYCNGGMHYFAGVYLYQVPSYLQGTIRDNISGNSNDTTVLISGWIMYANSNVSPGQYVQVGILHYPNGSSVLYEEYKNADPMPQPTFPWYATYSNGVNGPIYSWRKDLATLNTTSPVTTGKLTKSGDNYTISATNAAGQWFTADTVSVPGINHMEVYGEAGYSAGDTCQYMDFTFSNLQPYPLPTGWQNFDTDYLRYTHSFSGSTMESYLPF